MSAVGGEVGARQQDRVNPGGPVKNGGISLPIPIVIAWLWDISIYPQSIGDGIVEVGARLQHQPVAESVNRHIRL
jgi:hypothetical protein